MHFYLKNPGFLLLALLLGALAGVAHGNDASEPAPFGLRWGMQPAELREKAVYLVEQERMGNLVSYVSKHLPYDLEHVSTYTLLFDAELGLVRIQYLSKPIASDEDGMRGRERYRGLKLSLLEKYGMPDVDEVVGLDEHLSQGGFYACLQAEGCGWWHATYQADGLTIRLQLHGSGPAQGFISLDYESADFQAALARWEWLQRRDRERAL